jgi:hypothetical protein
MNNKYVKTDVEGLVKDPESGAILNISTDALEKYKKQKQNVLKVDLATQRLDKVENDLRDIKEMLHQLLKR